MKKCYKNIKSSSVLNRMLMLLLLGALFAANTLYAAPVAMITAVKGRAFVLHQNKTRTLVTGDVLEDFSEIMMEEGGQLTFVDYFDHRYHVSGSAHVRLLRRLVDLKSGYLWVQTMQQGQTGQVQTPNARADHQGAEFIISYNTASGKTQLLTLDSVVQFSNLLEEEFAIEVREGSFSFVDKEFENGRPRQGTNIGYQSFKKIVGLYPGIYPTRGESYLFPLESSDKGGTPSGRGIASVESTEVAPRSPATTGVPGEGDFIYRKLPEKIQSGTFNVEEYNKSKLQKIKENRPVKKWRPSYDSPSGVKINIFRAHTAPDNKGTKRAPASVGASTQRAMAIEINPQVVIPDNSGFETDLSREYKRQMRHSNEVNRLIDDLKNYESDYQINH